MVRKCASFAFCLALILALGAAIAHASIQKVAGASTDFFIPWEPPSPVFKAAGELKAATIQSPFATENTEAIAGIVGTSLVNAVTRVSSTPAPRAYPPLWRRPPPANS